MTKVKAGILTVSDLGFKGEREDTAGVRLKELCRGMGWTVSRYEVVPDERSLISDKLEQWAEEADIIFTCGGTGFAERDVTPEATIDVLDRLTPGISEAMRMAGLKNTPRAMLSRATSGIRGSTLIINLPGSEKGAVESFEAVREALPHALDVLRGEPGH